MKHSRAHFAALITFCSFGAIAQSLPAPACGPRGRVELVGSGPTATWRCYGENSSATPNARTGAVERFVDQVVDAALGTAEIDKAGAAIDLARDKLKFSSAETRSKFEKTLRSEVKSKAIELLRTNKCVDLILMVVAPSKEDVWKIVREAKTAIGALGTMNKAEHCKLFDAMDAHSDTYGLVDRNRREWAQCSARSAAIDEAARSLAQAYLNETSETMNACRSQ